MSPARSGHDVIQLSRSLDLSIETLESDTLLLYDLSSLIHTTDEAAMVMLDRLPWPFSQNMPRSTEIHQMADIGATPLHFAPLWVPLDIV